MVALNIINILILMSFGILIFISRYAILEIKVRNQKTYEKIVEDSHGFPKENDFGMMGYKTQLRLYKYLLLNKENIKKIIPTHQILFKLFTVFLVVLLVAQFISIINFVTQ